MLTISNNPLEHRLTSLMLGVVCLIKTNVLNGDNLCRGSEVDSSNLSLHYRQDYDVCPQVVGVLLVISVYGPV